MFKTIAKFLHEARVELAKVTWPTRQAAINLTLIVVGMSVLFMLYVTLVDYGLTTGIKWTATQAALIKAKQSPGASATPNINVGDIQTQTTPVK
jgi:preprotein translocase SecE subunit